jgi:putative glycosyltransferase (TIGR04348 family)
MRIVLVTPSFGHRLSGNEITARRYAGIFRDLGHHVEVDHAYAGSRCDLMIALHARRSFASISGFRRLNPANPLVVVLTGTDLYRDLKTHASARKSLELADRLVVFQQLGLKELPRVFRKKARVIHQSAPRFTRVFDRPKSQFRVCVAAHIRQEKDPFRAALAARLLPPSSAVRILHVGAAPDREMKTAALKHDKQNPRYRWLGAKSQAQTRHIIAGSHLLAITSRIEGGSNVLCEALAAGVPVVSARIPGIVGTLGRDYPGYFPQGDTRALARLLSRCENDPVFYRSLKSRCGTLARLVDPAKESRAWKRLLEELVKTG